MSKIIEERVTKMSFDNAMFEKAVAQSINTIEKLKSSLTMENASKALNGIAEAGSNIKTSIGGALEEVSGKFGALDIAAGVALGNMVTTAVSAGSRILKSLTLDPIIEGFNEYETQLNAVQTILANTQSKGSTLDDVNGALSELNKYADLTIYNFTEMTRNIGTFTAAGVGLNESVNAIKGIANLAAVSGSNSQQASTAMYQLSQALAAGKVQLQDWNSVVNAGMGGELFQNALIRTARVMGTGVDAAIEQYGTFRESLTKGAWLTSEVLTETLSQISGAYSEADLIAQGYTEDQAKEIAQLAETAINAATKVKTFTQLMDTVKEAVGSGWAQTWQIIIGDFEEARELWTGISDVLTGFIGKMSDARNSMLQAWKDAGGRTALLNSFKNILTGIYNLIKPFTDAFRALIPKVTGEQIAALCKGFEKLTSFFRVSEKTSQNLSKVLVALVSPFKVVHFVIGEVIKMFVALITIVSKPIITLFQSIAVSIVNFSAAVVDFVTKIGKAIQSTNIYLKAFDILTNYIKPMVNTMVDFLSKGYNKVVDALYSIRNIGQDDIVGFLNFIKVQLEPLSFIGEYIQNGVNQLMQYAPVVKEKLTSALTMFNDIIKNGSDSDAYWMLLTYVEAVQSKFEHFIEYVKSSTAILKEKSIFSIMNDYINEKFGPTISAISTYVGRALYVLKEAFGNAKDFTIDKFMLIVDKFKIASERLSEVGNIVNNGVKGMVQALKTAKDNIKSSADGFKEAINTVSEALDFDKFIQVIGGGAIVGIIWKLKKMFDDLMDIVKGKQLQNGFIDVLDNLAGTLEAYQKNLKADRLIKIAGAVAILAGALFVIAQIPVDKMLPAVGTLGAVIAELAVLMFAFDKIGDNKGIISSTKMIATMIGLATTLVIISSALKKVADVPTDKLLSSIGGLGLIMAELMSAMLIMTKVSQSMKGSSVVKTIVTMTALSLVLSSLAKTMIKMAELDWGQIARGSVAIAVMCTALIVSANSISKNASKIKKAAVGMISFTSALKAMAKVVEKLGGLDTDVLVKGLIAISTVLGALTLFLNFAKLDGMSGSKGLGLLLLATSLLVLSSAIKKFEDVDAMSMVKGLLTLVVMTKMLNSIPGMISTAIGFSILGVALLGIAAAIRSFANIDTLQMAKGLISIAGAMSVIALAMKLMPGSAISKAVSVSILMSQLTKLGKAITSMGSMQLSTIAKGLIAMAGALAIITVAANAMNGSVMGAAAIVVLSFALGSLAKALQAFGSMSLETIGIGLLAMAGVFTVLGIAGALLTPVVPVLLALAGVFALLGVGTLALGAGLTVAATGLAALAASGAAGFAVIVNGIKGLLNLIPLLIVKIGEGLIAALKVFSDNMPVITEFVINAFKGMITAMIALIPLIVSGLMTLITTLLEAITERLPDFIEAGYNLLICFLQGVRDHIGEVVETALEVIANFLYGVANKIDEVVDAGIEVIFAFITAVIRGLGTKLPELITAVSDAFSDVAEAGVNALKEWVTDFISMGADLVAGLIKGIYSGISGVVGAIVDVAKSAINSGKEELDINSPSKEFEEMGMYCDEGLAKGLTRYSGLVTDATSGVGKETMDEIRRILNDIDWEGPNNDGPVIRPVLDLSDVESGAATMNDLFKNQAVNVGMTGVGTASLRNISALSRSSAGIQNDNSDIVTAIKDLNKTMKNNPGGNSYNVNGVTYDDGSNVANAIGTLVRAAKIRRRT